MAAAEAAAGAAASSAATTAAAFLAEALAGIAAAKATLTGRVACKAQVLRWNSQAFESCMTTAKVVSHNKAGFPLQTIPAGLLVTPQSMRTPLTQRHLRMKERCCKCGPPSLVNMRLCLA